MRKTRIFEELHEIRRLRVLGVPGYEIMKMMNLSRHCYQDRVSRMNKIDEEYVLNRFHNKIATEIVMLQERLLSDIRTCEEIASDKNIDASKRLDALRLKIECSIGMVTILQKGCRALSKDFRDSIIGRESGLSLDTQEQLERHVIGEQEEEVVEQEEEQEEEYSPRRPSDEVF